MKNAGVGGDWYTGDEASPNEAATVGRVKGFEYLIKYSEHRGWDMEHSSQEYFLRYLGDWFIMKWKYQNLEMEDLMDSMEYISKFYFENTNENKNNLIGILERKSYENYLNLFENFTKVNEELNKLKEIILNLKKKNEKIKNEIKNQDFFLEKIKKIEIEIKKIKEKENFILNFISKYQLTNEEKEIIMIGEINLNFFSIFEKINKIQKECKNMLRNQQKSGIEIIDEMSIYQDT